MADLIAQGNEPHHRWRRKLPSDQPVVVGREAGRWSVPWDERVSRRHVSLFQARGQLRATALADARNPIFFRGRRVTEFTLSAGEHFVIGGTTFTFADEQLAASLAVPLPYAEQTFTPQELHDRAYQHPDVRLTALGRLPGLIGQSATESELLAGVVAIGLSGAPTAVAVAVARVPANGEPIVMLQWDHRVSGKAWAPSERLFRVTMTRQAAVACTWAGDSPSAAEFTAANEIDWALCVPAPGETCAGWAIYVAGKFLPSQPATIEALADDLKFIELLASTLGSLRDAQRGAQRQTLLSQFLSPVVVESLGGQAPDVALAPREAELAVLFCDLRGYSRQSERWSGSLLELLERVSHALGVMTHQILRHGGVVGDFHGDSAMGFWGWPTASTAAPQQACRAALAIRREFLALRQETALLGGGFQVGIGIATGRAVAGKLGTSDQVKVTAFGPVVNLASRLEGLTKTIHAPILIDGATAEALRAAAPFAEGRVRRIAAVRPRGMDRPVELHELLPPLDELPNLRDVDLAAYERAWELMRDGDWAAAFTTLHAVPAEDRVKDFLAMAILKHHRQAPPQWEGVMEMEEK